MDWLRDIRLGLRRLLAESGYTAAVVLTLAGAIGANSAVFSAVYAVLLSPLGLTAPRDLVVCWKTDPTQRAGVVELSYDEVQRWSDAAPGFIHLAAMGSSNWTMVLDNGGDPVRVAYSAVTPPFFATLGARPLLGRVFEREDEDVNAPAVVVLGYGMWVRRFGGRPNVIGETIRLDGLAYTVVGVMPKEFGFPRGAEFWTPVGRELMAASARWKLNALSDVGVLLAIGRLRPGTPVSEARAGLNLMVTEQRPVGSPSPVVVQPFLDYFFGPARSAFWLLLAAVAMVLLIACMNVSGVMLARSSLRARERAIQLALGASRARIAWLVTVETLLPCAAGGILGLGATHWITHLIVWLGPDDMPRLAASAVNTPVVIFTLVTVALTALLCGVGPVRRAQATNLLDSLAGGVRATGSDRLKHRATAVACQLALAVVLLIGSALVVRSFANLRSLDLGFSPAHVLTMNVTTQDGGSTNEWFSELLRQLATVRGVEAVGGVSTPPLALGPIGDDSWVILEGQTDTVAVRRSNPTLNHLVATSGYFEAMHIPLKRGRLFDARDHANGSRAIILGESAARALWPGQDPIGKRLGLPSSEPGRAGTDWRTVVGIVSDVHYRGVTDVRLDVYGPAQQDGPAVTNLVVRTDADPLGMADAVQSAIRAFDPHAVIDRVDTMEAAVARVEAPWRLIAWVFSVFAMAAAGLAALGLFSVVNLEVTGRRHEFAVRLALGAEPRAILGMTMAAACRRAAVGVTAGLVLAVALTRTLTAFLFGVRALDPWSYVGAAGVVMIAVACAAYGPAKRAAAVDPMALLRRE